MIPTLVAFRNIVRQATDVTEYLRDPNLAYLAPTMRERLEPARNTYATRFPPEILPALSVDYDFQRQLVQALHKGGVPILAGTDASWLGVPGFCLLDEIQIFQELGFSPYAAIRTATADPAKFLRHEEDFGTVQPGRRADLILTRQNPLEDARRLRDPEGVMVHGRWIPAAEKKTLLAGIAPSYRRTLERLETQLSSDPRGVDAYLAANDPLGLLASGLLLGVAEKSTPAGLTAMLRKAHESNADSPLTSEQSLNEFGYSTARGEEERGGGRGLQAEHGAVPEVGEHVRQPGRDLPRARRRGRGAEKLRTRARGAARLFEREGGEGAAGDETQLIRDSEVAVGRP